MLKLSVVVIGRNEGTRLERCFQSLREMHPIDGGVEWIYVDSASTDQSVAYARAQGAQVIELRASRPSAALARKIGRAHV